MVRGVCGLPLIGQGAWLFREFMMVRWAPVGLPAELRPAPGISHPSSHPRTARVMDALLDGTSRWPLESAMKTLAGLLDHPPSQRILFHREARTSVGERGARPQATSLFSRLQWLPGLGPEKPGTSPWAATRWQGCRDAGHWVSPIASQGP